MPNHKNPWSEPPDHGIGRSRGGLTTKLHLVCDGRGRPLSMMITAGNINDTTMMSAVLENIRVPRDGKGRPRTRPDRVLADKGYPSRANRAWLRDRRIAATIPERDDQIAHRRKKPGRPIAFGDKQKRNSRRLATPHLLDQHALGVQLPCNECGHAGNGEGDDSVFRGIHQALPDQRGAGRAQAFWTLAEP